MDNESGFNRVRNIRMYEAVLEQLIRYIKVRRLDVGDRFPPERDMAAEMGVSRATLREAFRVLESLGVVRSKIGGGRFLEAFNPSIFEDGFGPLRVRVGSLIEVWEARLIMEVGAVRLVVERASPEELDELAEFAGRVHSCTMEEFREKDYDLEFHARLAQATHNEVIADNVRYYMRILKRMRQKWLMDAEVWKQSCEEHISIVDAILARDAELAAVEMRKHILGIKRAVLAYVKVAERS